MRQAKVFAGVCVYKYWEPESRRSFDELISYSGRDNWVLSHFQELYGESLISRGRNTIMEKFIESKDDYLFTMDADIVCFTPHALRELVNDISGPSVGITSAPYIYKNPPYRWAFRPYEVGDYDMRSKNRRFKVKYTSSGFMLVSRDAATYAIKAWRECNGNLYQPLYHEGEYLSEDWALCRRISSCDYLIYVNPLIKLGHIGQYIFTEQDFYGLLERENNAKKLIKEIS